MSKLYKEFQLNRPQARFQMVQARENYALMSRGTGKTTGISAPFALHKVKNLPGSCGALPGRSFKDLESKILKPLFEGFRMNGYRDGKEVIYGKKPPEDWENPLIKIFDYKHVISFRNGTTIQLVSMHEEASANSNSFQWLFIPEAKYMDEDQLRSEVYPTLRGLVDHFGDSPWYGAMLLETDKWGTNLKWLLDKRKLHDEKMVAFVIYWQMEINKLYAKLTTAGERMSFNIRAEITKITDMLAKIRKNMVYVAEANALDNIKNLHPSYIKNMHSILTENEFRVAILNQDPTRAEMGFYPERNKRHIYHPALPDENYTKPLIMTMDWQAAITPIVLAQVNDLVVPGRKTLNIVNTFYVKWPQGIEHAIQKMCDYYEHRLCKKVIFMYDHTAIAKSSRGGSFQEDVVMYLKRNHWDCECVFMGDAPDHDVKYREINKYLKEEDGAAFPIRFNGDRCVELVQAIDKTGILPGTLTQKDKRDEKNPKIDQLGTTHFPDAFDQLVWGVNYMGLYVDGGGTGGGFVAFGS